MSSVMKKVDIDKIKHIALEAGKATMEIYKKDFKVEHKEDNSPLTQADRLANEIICERLQEQYPDIPLLSEENKEVPYETRKNWEHYWCIDPIDGTKEFIKKNGEFTVNIALVEKDTPVLGVVYAPALQELYWAKRSEGAYRAMLNDECLVMDEERLPIVKNLNIQNSISIVASKSHLSSETKEFIDNLTSGIEHSKLVSRGSSLKLCMVATGEADVYPRLAPTMEWDTAAADAIVREAGKMTYQYHLASNTRELENPLVYNKKELLNPWFVVR